MSFEQERAARLRREIAELQAEIDPYERGLQRVSQSGIDLTPQRIEVIKAEIAAKAKALNAQGS